MDAEQPNVGVPTPPRFFCHRCNVDFEDASQDYKCPFCNSGFIEQLNSNGNAFDSTMNPMDDGDDQSSGHPMLHDLAFLMSGGRVRPGNRDSFIEQLVLSMGGGEALPPGGVTAGTPFVLVGAPGDYVIGGEGLDAVVTQLLGQLEHSGPPPLTRDLIASIPTEDVREEHMANGNTCSVCWDAYNLGEKLSRLECDHIFHKKCIDPWLNLHATCPICRRNLLPPGANPRPEDEPVMTTGFVNIRTDRTNPLNPPTNAAPQRLGDNTVTPNDPERPYNPHRIRIPNPYMRTMYNPANWPAAMAQLAAANLTGTIGNLVQGPNFIFNAQTGLNPEMAAGLTAANAANAQNAATGSNPVNAGQNQNAQAASVPNADGTQDTGTNTDDPHAPTGTNAPAGNATGSNAASVLTHPHRELRRILQRVSMTPTTFYTWGAVPTAAPAPAPAPPSGSAPPPPQYNTDIDYD